MNLPIFSSQKKSPLQKLQEIKKRKLANSEIGLANSLLGFSTGKMPSLWNRLSEFNFPVLL
jgi:2-succinyl-6-hydroxy-2,4-cyclohexadiene-1-carboxylate synthase